MWQLPDGDGAVWKWAAGLLAAALTGILGVVANAVVKKPEGSADPHTWERERSGVMARLTALETENMGLRMAKHDHAGKLTAAALHAHETEREVSGLKERLARLEGRT